MKMKEDIAQAITHSIKIEMNFIFIQSSHFIWSGEINQFIFTSFNK